MKNRLELSRDLLRKDGIISIIIGEDGYAELKLLCDEVFDSNNYETTITCTWKKTDSQAKLGRMPLSEKAKKEYSYQDNRGQYRRTNILGQTRGKI